MHCCADEGSTCYCQYDGVSCASGPANLSTELTLAKDALVETRTTADDANAGCSAGCTSTCINAGMHCCGDGGGTCYCQYDGVSCASGPANHSSEIALAKEALVEMITSDDANVGCSSGCISTCLNAGMHCCADEGSTCYCQYDGVSCASGPGNHSFELSLAKEGSAVLI